MVNLFGWISKLQLQCIKVYWWKILQKDLKYHPDSHPANHTDRHTVFYLVMDKTRMTTSMKAKLWKGKTNGYFPVRIFFNFENAFKKVNLACFKWMYGLSVYSSRVVELSELYLAVIGIIMQSLKSIGHISELTKIYNPYGRTERP